MHSETSGARPWPHTPPGNYLLAWEQQRFDEAVGDLFGYHALQLGLAEIDTLRANRVPHQWLAEIPMARAQAGRGPLTGVADLPDKTPRPVAFLTEPAALPFSENSLDLVTLPHTLELGDDPHSTLHEVVRVLVPGGRLIVSGFNPASLWGLRQRCGRALRDVGWRTVPVFPTGEGIGYWRLRDWLRLLNFEVESARFGCYRPPFASQQWLERFGWMEPAGQRWWPVFGAAYFLVAVKRVHGMRLMEPAWKARKVSAAIPIATAQRQSSHSENPAAVPWQALPIVDLPIYLQTCLDTTTAPP